MREILLIEDDVEICSVLTDILSEYGYSIVARSDGLAGLEWMRAATVTPQVILLDLQMPRLNGWEFVDLLRSEPRWRQIPVVVLSAVKASPPPGIVAFLPKPIALDRLLRVLDQYCPPLAPLHAYGEPSGS